MFTSIDKALVALIMGVVFLLNEFVGINLGFITEDVVTTAVGLLTPVLVYLVPNRDTA